MLNMSDKDIPILLLTLTGVFIANNLLNVYKQNM